MRTGKHHVVAILAVLLACSDTETEEIDDAVTVCYFDCPICFPACGGCVEICVGCPNVKPAGNPTDGVLPGGGLWFGSWSCLSGCSLVPPTLTAALSADVRHVPFDAIVWRNDPASFPVLEAAVEEMENCWRIEASQYGCRSVIDVCGTFCPDGAPCIVATGTWTGIPSGAQQRWRFVGRR